VQDQVGLYWIRWDRAGPGRIILSWVRLDRAGSWNRQGYIKYIESGGIVQDQVGLYWVRWDHLCLGKVLLGQMGACRIR
jgi:hypothetical protein